MHKVKIQNIIRRVLIGVNFIFKSFYNDDDIIRRF